MTIETLNNAFQITALEYTRVGPKLETVTFTREDVCECFNATDCDVEGEQVWIEGAQLGHWLDEHEIDKLFQFLKSRNDDAR